MLQPQKLSRSGVRSERIFRSVECKEAPISKYITRLVEKNYLSGGRAEKSLLPFRPQLNDRNQTCATSRVTLCQRDEAIGKVHYRMPARFSHVFAPLQRLSFGPQSSEPRRHLSVPGSSRPFPFGIAPEGYPHPL